MLRIERLVHAHAHELLVETDPLAVLVLLELEDCAAHGAQSPNVLLSHRLRRNLGRLLGAEFAHSSAAQVAVFQRLEDSLRGLAAQLAAHASEVRRRGL